MSHVALTIKQIQQGLRAKEFSAKEITEGYLKQISAKDSDINAYLEVFRDSSLAQAQRVDELIAEGGQLSPLSGVPIALKDNMLVTGKHASAASKMLENHVATYDAHVVKKLKSEQAVILGRTNMDEFAMGSSTENSAFGPTKNPHDLTRVPGGSSGGSAAAVAADMAVAALGSDTGGSIRQPAHCTGVVGLKPTYGAVSRSGLIAMASSLDQIGPLTKTVEDAAIVFKAIAGKDAYDNTTVAPTNTDGTRTDTDKSMRELTNPDFASIKKLKIGLPKEYFISGIEPEVQKAVQSAIDFYQKQGIEVKEISLPHTKYALSCYYIIMPAEVSSNLARFDGVRYSRTADVRGLDADLRGKGENSLSLLDIYKKSKSLGYGPETKRRVILGTFVLSSGYYDAYYKKALDVKEYITEDFTNAFKEVDVILTPVAPTRAFKLGEKTADPLAMYLSDIFTIPANIAGIPAISIPVRQGKSDKVNGNSAAMSHVALTSSLPIGFQLMGKHWREQDILGLGMLYEQL